MVPSHSSDTADHRGSPKPAQSRRLWTLTIDETDRVNLRYTGAHRKTAKQRRALEGHGVVNCVCFRCPQRHIQLVHRWRSGQVEVNAISFAQFLLIGRISRGGSSLFHTHAMNSRSRCVSHAFHALRSNSVAKSVSISPLVGTSVSQPMDHYSPRLSSRFPSYEQSKSSSRKFQRQEKTQLAPWDSSEFSSSETLDSLSQAKQCACGSIHSNGATSLQDLAHLYEQSSAQLNQVDAVTLVPIKLRSSTSYPDYSDACEDEDVPLQLVPIESYSPEYFTPASYVSTLKIDIGPSKRMKKSVSHELPKLSIRTVDRKRVVQSKSEGELLNDPRRNVYTPSITVAHFLGKDSKVFLETHFPCWKEMTV